MRDGKKNRRGERRVLFSSSLGPSVRLSVCPAVRLSIRPSGCPSVRAPGFGFREATARNETSG
eukprot:scaffold109_cov252-Pinguiococcus_pyrenoidosus.AAC.1